MSRLHIHVQVLPPPHHGPAGHVTTITGEPDFCGEHVLRALQLASNDGSLTNGGCLSITVQRVPPKLAKEN